MTVAQTSPQGPGRGAQRAHGVKSREAILDAAEELFAERGYAGTGISAISKVSGLPASSIYWFFESKDELLAATFERALDRWIETLGATLEGPPEERLERLMRHGLTTFQARLPLFLRMEIMLALERGERDAALLERLQRGRERARSLMQDALAGHLSDLGERAQGLGDDLASLAISLVSGAFLGHQLEPERIDLDRFA